MLRATWILWVMLFFVVPARAVEVLDVAPLHTTPQQTVRMTLHLQSFDRIEAVRTYRYGNVIQVYVILSDVVVVGQPPLTERTEVFDLGRFPVGEYQLDVYAGAVSYYPLLQSYTLGVTAPVALPATSYVSRLLLFIAMGLAGCIALVRMRAHP